jgi:hypothetical protein
VHPGAVLTGEARGRVVAATRTDVAAFAVVELKGGRRVLAYGEGERKPAIDDIVTLWPLNEELCTLVVDSG